MATIWVFQKFYFCSQGAGGAAQVVSIWGNSAYPALVFLISKNFNFYIQGYNLLCP
jgi:hypothetical protein